MANVDPSSITGTGSAIVPYANAPFFFFNDTATTEIYTLSLHDALPISARAWEAIPPCGGSSIRHNARRSEEHTSELQSQSNRVCRLLLEKKKELKEGQSRLTNALRSPLADLRCSD